MGKNKKDESDDKVLPTKCSDWSLNKDSEGQKLFWWNKVYSISIWTNNMPSLKEPLEEATDTDVWKAFIEYQLAAVYRMCPICALPEGNDDLLICCYCGQTVHRECSVPATVEQCAWKPANAAFNIKLMCACDDCEDVKGKPKRVAQEEPDNARRAARRSLASSAEYPSDVTAEVKEIIAQAELEHSGDQDAKLLNQLQRALARYFQPTASSPQVKKDRIATKGNGIGIVAVVNIPAFTVVGVYPGYEDPLSGEQAKLGRPSPKYSLVDLNCADFYNKVFAELHLTHTPFINEPNVGERSNTAWIQETPKPEGRLSIMTVRDIAAGEELLIGYGPLYPRDYPHTYDAYAFHIVEGYEPPCFALWHWPSTEEKDAVFVCYIGYDAAANSYAYWDTEEEEEAKKKNPNSDPSKPRPKK